MRVDLPEPETPVTHTSRFKGMRTSIFFKLWARAPFNSSHLFGRHSATGSADAARGARAVQTSFLPLKYSPVSECALFLIAARLPIEREIAEPHVIQIRKARADLSKQLIGCGIERRRQRESLEEIAGALERQQ